jgi:HEPN domain-containing protein
MSSASDKAANDWLDRAVDSLAGAEMALAMDLPQPGAAAFRCRQAAIKALQAYLLARGESFAGALRLPDLLDLCRQHDDEFGLLVNAAERLEPYCEHGHPHETATDAAVAQAQIALEMATAVVHFVRARL